MLQPIRSRLVHGNPDVVDDPHRSGELLWRQPPRQESLLPQDAGYLDPREVDRRHGNRAVDKLLLQFLGMLKSVLVDEPAEKHPRIDVRQENDRDV
jgi:hypothetical protein